MSKKDPSFLVLQKHGYCFRMRVPSFLKKEPLFTLELRYSLKTHDRLEAKSMALRIGRKVRELFKNLKLNGALRRNMTEVELKKIVKQFVEDSLYVSEMDRLAQTNLTRERHEAASLYYAELNYQSYEAFTKRNYGFVAECAKSYLNDFGVAHPKDTLEFNRLCRELIRAVGFASAINRQRELGVYDDMRQYDPDFHDTYFPPSDSGTIVFPAPRPQLPDSPLLSEAIDRFLKERTNARQWRKYYQKEMTACLRLFQEFVGKDIHTWEIDSKLVVSFKEALMRLPANRNKVRAYREKPLSELLKLDIAVPMALNTIDKYLTRLGTFLAYAKNHGYVAENYATGIKLKPVLRDDEERKAFTRAEMKRMLNTPEVQKREFEHDWQFWAFLFAAFAGLRANEIGQLDLEDIYQIEGIWVVDVNANGPDKKLKRCTHSKRIVPLHPIFVEKGLPDYVKTLQEAGEKKLFPTLLKGKKGYGEKISRAFNGNGHYRGYLRRWGVKGPHDKTAKVFHSFRHTFATHLAEQGVAEIHILRLLGHKTGYEGLDRYSKAALARGHYVEAIERIDYFR